MDQSSQPQPDDKAPKKEPGKGWIEKLAEKSAGLPSPEKPAPKEETKNSPWKYAGLGIQFAGTVGVMAYLGYLIDQWQGWKNSPALITAVVIGVIGGLYLLIKEQIKANK